MTPERRATLVAYLRQMSKPWPNELADEVERLAGIVDALPPRLARIFEALATLTLPDGWSAEYNDGPVGIVLRRNGDGWVSLIVPSTDGTPRWYNDYSIDGRLGGNAAGMSDTAQDAVGYSVEHAPDYPREDDEG